MSARERVNPNIVFILSDDQGCWAMGCAGNEEMRTPNLDRLAATGVRFENFFCASPVCSPARASVLTGRIPSRHGVHDWLRAGNTTADHEQEPPHGCQLIEYLKDQPGYTDCLAAAGYVCGISGKWHLGDSHHPQKGFRFWEVHARGGGPYYNAPMIREGEVYQEPRYVTDAITDNALRFLEAQKESGWPFYLSVHYTAPHSPWERDHHPANLFDDYHDHCPFASLPDGLTPPEWVRDVTIPVRDAATRRVYLSGYFAAVTAMDSNIGRLLDWLEANDLRQDTLVCFMSDNGMNMGHHGVYGKGNATRPLNMFDESVKVPFIVSRPEHVPQGGTAFELLSQYDVMPTLLEYASVESPKDERLPGRSFAGLLRGETGAGRGYVVVYDEYGPVRMVRTREWKYVHRCPDGPHELYHLAHDPSEQTNLAADAAYAGRVKELKASLEDWFARYADPDRDGRAQPVTGSGQCGLVSPLGGDDSFL
jgi:arylsulfatase A-like enzyme